MYTSVPLLFGNNWKTLAAFGNIRGPMPQKWKH